MTGIKAGYGVSKKKERVLCGSCVAGLFPFGEPSHFKKNLCNGGNDEERSNPQRIADTGSRVDTLTDVEVYASMQRLRIRMAASAISGPLQGLTRSYKVVLQAIRRVGSKRAASHGRQNHTVIRYNQLVFPTCQVSQ